MSQQAPQTQENKNSDWSPTRRRIHDIIFEADTPAGKWFDIILLVFIVISVVAVMLESVKSFDLKYHRILFITEWVLTVAFTIEYGLRLYSVRKPWKYATSFYGIVDLLAILPTYLSLVFAGSHYLLIIRALRLLRVFRIFKLTRFLSESTTLLLALKASRTKISVFLGTVIIIVAIVGSGMYMIEGANNPGFSSIPKAMYWAIVTLTTVGFGDITPQTSLGQLLSAILMIMGYAIIAVPTGIVSVEMARATNKPVSTQSCPHCSRDGHDIDAKHCKYCGGDLHI